MKNLNKKLFITHKLKIICGLGLFVLLIFGVMRKSEPEKSNSLGQAIKQDLVQKITIAGTIVPFKKSVIMAPYPGYIKKLYVKIGDQVKAGDPLVSVVQSLQSNDNVYPLRAPFSGTVVQVEKSEGEFAKDGDPKEFIMRVDDSSRLFIVANTPEIDRLKVKAGQEVIIKASAIVNKTYQGIIRELSLAARSKEEWSRSQVVEFPIRIEITSADQDLKAGMSVVIDVITAKKENILTLRHEFIRREKEQYFVTLNSGERRNIKVGIQNEDGFEILDGLTEKDKIKLINFADIVEN